MKLLVVKIIICIGLVALFISCDEDPKPRKIVLQTSSGQELEMEGMWNTGCVEFEGSRIREIFQFTNNQANISILFYSDENCTQVVQSQQIDFKIRVSGLIDVTLDGETVTANKVEGNAVNADGETNYVKQSFFVDDNGPETKLYFGASADEGAPQSVDGFPLELIPVAIIKQ